MVIPRVLKSVKTAEKVLDEITDLGKRDFGLGGEKTCPKKKLFDESDFDAEDLGKNSADDYVNLVNEKRKQHILDGDETGGGHRHGTGIKGKTEFPKTWDDNKIMNYISDIATDPNSEITIGRGGRQIIIGEREGIKIKVVLESLEKGGNIITAYPIYE